MGQVISRTRTASSILDLESKKIIGNMIKVDTVAATGSLISDAAPLNYGRNAVTAANGTKAVKLPAAEIDSSVTVINTVSNQTLVVFPFKAADQINAITAGSSFSQLGGSRAEYLCDANGHWYVAAANLTGTSTSSSTAELDTLASVTAGTVAASKAVVVNSAKSVDVLQATTAFSVGGTGVPGAAAVETMVTKAVTAFLDTTAKTVFTVTVPNAVHNAVIEIDSVAALGAGGAIGAGEATMSTKYAVSLARTAGVNVVAGVSSILASSKAKVAGADDFTSVVVTTGAVSGAVGASNTFTIQVAMSRSGAGATNHTGTFAARIINANATGVTIA